MHLKKFPETIIASFEIINFSRMLFGLDWDGNILHICTKTFLVHSLNIDILFDDVLLIHDISGSRILGITKKTEAGISYLQMLSYPGVHIIKYLIDALCMIFLNYCSSLF